MLRPARLAMTFVLITVPLSAMAERVTSRANFVALVEGRDLSAFGVTMRVAGDGRIGGRAFGRDVTGTWEWNKGWFCRTLAWGSREWPLDCQLVEYEGNAVVFTADKGAGDRAALTLR